MSLNVKPRDKGPWMRASNAIDWTLVLVLVALAARLAGCW